MVFRYEAVQLNVQLFPPYHVFVNMEQPEKSKRIKVSKNKKKNWNKVCDIKEVEDYLEEKRFEERIGYVSI